MYLYKYFKSIIYTYINSIQKSIAYNSVNIKYFIFIIFYYIIYHIPIYTYMSNYITYKVYSSIINKSTQHSDCLQIFDIIFYFM